MEFFDSHAHYDDEQFKEDREELIQLIYNAGITKFMSAGYDVLSSKMGLELANKYEFIFTTSGISPNDMQDTIQGTETQIREIEKIIQEDRNNSQIKSRRSKIVGVGEIGLDYHWNKENKEIQRFAFIEQINMANRFELPIIIHTREAVMDTIEILKSNPVSQKGVFHCCPLNKELVKEGLKLGFYISFAGPTTFKNSKNAEEIIDMVPEDRMLIETDSPYLTPEPLRGTRNDSRNVKYIAKKIAEVKKISLQEVAAMTYNNALQIFKIDA